jgi:hypothetical protein
MLTLEGSVTPSTQPDPEPTTFNPAAIREFTPQNPLISQTFDTSHNVRSLLLFKGGEERSC